MALDEKSGGNLTLGSLDEDFCHGALKILSFNSFNSRVEKYNKMKTYLEELNRRFVGRRKNQ